MLLYKDLVAAGQRYPDRIALSCHEDDITYSKLHNLVRELSFGLRETGLTSGLRVGLLLHNSIEFVIALYAISFLDCVSVLLSSELSPDDIEREYERLGLNVLIIENYTHNHLRARRGSLASDALIVLRNRGPANLTYLSELHEIGRRSLRTESRQDCLKLDDPNKQIIIQSSSGTTGSRKSAYRTLGNIDSDLDSIISTLRYDPEDTIYCPAPLYHGYGLTMGLLAPIRRGCRIIIDRWFMTNRAVRIVDSMHPSVFIGVPEIFDSMVNSRADCDLNTLRLCLCSGEPICMETTLKFNKKYGIWINQVYGMMEASSISVNLEPNKGNVLSVGKPFHGVSVQINETKTDIKEAIRNGEILIQSRAISPAYVSGQGDANIQLADGWFSSGDRGYFDADGNLHINGRKLVHPEE